MSSIGSSVDSLQQPRLDHGPSPEGPADLHSGETQTLPGSQRPSLDTLGLACPGPPLSPPEIDSPSWKRLISPSLAAHERTSLIATMFSKRDEVEATRQIGGDDAQTFVNLIYEVRSHHLVSPKNDPLTSSPYPSGVG